MISTIVSRLVILVFGTLYPAYASYKAVRTKNVKEYVKWMMYWIVFALFTCAETFTDVFLSWFPFYYEIKIILVLWLLSPATKGSSILYRKFVHPMLSSREQEIDDYIAKAKEQGYHTVLHLGTKGVNYATTVIMQTAIKSAQNLNLSYAAIPPSISEPSVSTMADRMETDMAMGRSQSSHELPFTRDVDQLADVEMSEDEDISEPQLDRKGGGGLVNQLRKSYSLSDLSSDTDARADTRGLQQRLEESEDVVDSRVIRRRRSPHRSSSGSGRVDIFFSEMDVRPGPSLGHVRSIEDVSSGYSSAEPLYVGQPAKVEGREGLVRTASVGGGSSRLRTRTTRAGLTTKKTNLPEDSEYSEEKESGAKKATVQRTVKLNQKKMNQLPETREGNGSSDTSSEFLDSLDFPEETDSTPPKEVPERSIAPGPSKTEVRNFDSCNVEIETHQESLQELVGDLIESVLTESDNISLVRDSEKETTEIVPSNNDQLTNEKVLVDTEVTETQFTETSNVESSQESVQKPPLEVETCSVVEEEIKESTEKENLAKNELPETEIEKQNEECELNKEDTALVSQNLKSDVVDNKIITDDNDTQKTEPKTISDNENLERGGRYNKLLAPIPPTDSSSAVITSQESHPIKATLILKPGVIKSLAPLNDSASSSEIFLAHSPKSKRKSGAQKKYESPISRLMMLPKKLWGHKNVDRNVYPGDIKTKEKRSSWHVDAQFLIGGSHSKSDNEGYDDQAASPKVDRKATSAIDINNYNEDKLFVRNLSHSPKQYRRKTAYNPDDYDDSD